MCLLNQTADSICNWWFCMDLLNQTVDSICSRWFLLDLLNQTADSICSRWFCMDCWIKQVIRFVRDGSVWIVGSNR